MAEPTKAQRQAFDDLLRKDEQRRIFDDVVESLADDPDNAGRLPSGSLLTAPSDAVAQGLRGVMEGADNLASRAATFMRGNPKGSSFSSAEINEEFLGGLWNRDPKRVLRSLQMQFQNWDDNYVDIDLTSEETKEAITGVSGEPETVFDAAFRSAGRFVPEFAIPAGVAAKGAQAVGSTAKTAKFLANPKNVPIEATAAAMGAAAGKSAEKLGAGDTVQIAAEIAGGFGPTAIPAAGRAVHKLAGSPFSSLTDAGANRLAKEDIQRRIVGENATLEQSEARLRAAQESFDAPTTVPMTPAQRTGSADVASLEDVMALTRPDLRENLDEMAMRQIDAVRGAFPTEQDLRKSQDIMELEKSASMARIEDLQDAARKQGQDALDAADDPIRRMADPTVGEMGARVSDELNKFIESEGVKIRSLWEKLPDNMLVGTSNFRKAWDNLSPQNVAGLEDVWQDLPPSFARYAAARFENLGGYAPKVAKSKNVSTDIDWSEYTWEPPKFGVAPKQEEVRQLHALSSRLKMLSRQYGKNWPDLRERKLGRIAGDLAGAVDADLESVPEVAKAYVPAKEATAAYYRKVGRDAPRSLLSRLETGERRVPAAEAAETTLGKGSPTARLGASRELAETGVSERTVTGWFGREFAEAGIATDRGSIDTGKLKGWMHQNRDLLKTWPELRKVLQPVLKAKEDAAVSIQQSDDTIEALTQKIVEIEKGPKSKFAAAQVDKAWNTIMAADRPGKAALELMKDAGDDVVKQRGIKAAAIRSMLESGIRQDGTFDGDALVRFSKQPRTLDEADALRAVLTDDEMNNFRKIAQEIKKALQRNPQAVTNLGEDATPFLVDRSAQILGAMLGRTIPGPGTIQVPGQVSAATRGIVNGFFNAKKENAILAALQNEDIMRAMLKPIKTAEDARRARQKLLAVFIGTSYAVTDTLTDGD